MENLWFLSCGPWYWQYSVFLFIVFLENWHRLCGVHSKTRFLYSTSRHFRGKLRTKMQNTASIEAQKIKISNSPFTWMIRNHCIERRLAKIKYVCAWKTMPFYAVSKGGAHFPALIREGGGGGGGNMYGIRARTSSPSNAPLLCRTCHVTMAVAIWPIARIYYNLFYICIISYILIIAFHH